MTPDNSKEPELALEAPEGVLDAIMELLPRHSVRVCYGHVICPVVTSVVEDMVSNALARGYLIDRTNGGGPLDEWDGWILIDTPEGIVYIATDKRKALDTMQERTLP